MAHAGGVKPSIEMWVEGGELHTGTSAQRVGVVSDIDLAVQRLLQGEKVFVQKYGDLTERVTKSVEMALQKGK